MVIFCLYLLYQTVGSVAFYAVTAALLFSLLQYPVNAVLLRLRLKLSEYSDARIRFLETLVKGILTVKSYGWEAPLTAQAKAVRKKEIWRLKSYYAVSGFFNGFFLYCDPLLSLSVLLGLVLSGKQL